MREREREGERERRRAEAQVVNTYKPMPSESKFVIRVKERSNGNLNPKKYTKSIYCERPVYYFLGTMNFLVLRY